jgi:hypothetical protein
MIICPVHGIEVEIDDHSHGAYFAGWCPEDGGHVAEVEAF